MMTLPQELYPFFLKNLGFFSKDRLALAQTCSTFYNEHKKLIVEQPELPKKLNPSQSVQQLSIEAKIGLAQGNEILGFFILTLYPHELGKYNARLLFSLNEFAFQGQPNPQNLKEHSGGYWYDLALTHPDTKQRVLKLDAENNYLSPDLKNRLNENAEVIRACQFTF